MDFTPHTDFDNLTQAVYKQDQINKGAIQDVLNLNLMNQSEVMVLR